MAKSDRCCLRDVKAATCSGPHVKSFAPCSVLRKGILRSADLEMNLFRAVNLPVRRLKGKCAVGPFLSILVIECKHKCLNAHG
jgi:hypothetical protein